MTPAAGQYITLAGGGISVRGLRGQTAPSLTGGFGGWTQVARPRRKAITQWDGGTPYELAFSLIFDGVTDGTSVSPDCTKLEQLARPLRDGADPPTVRVTGAVPHNDLDWVISDLAWDPAPIYAAGGFRIRAEVTVKLLEHVPPTLVGGATDTAAAAAAAKAGGTRTYLVKKGDTLSSIAAKQPKALHITWKQIADLNGIRDPRTLKTGQRLKLP